MATKKLWSDETLRNTFSTKDSLNAKGMRDDYETMLDTYRRDLACLQEVIASLRQQIDAFEEAADEKEALKLLEY